jgi:tetratricopeptide (TPR) repeat protein
VTVMALAIGRGEVITFYSFKGGVGRSMALANIAALAAQRGKRVLALDFDFEAPGLHRYLLKPERHEPAPAQQSGVLNLFAALRDQLHVAFPAGQGLQDADAPARLQKLVAGEIDSDKYLYRIRLDDPNRRKPHTVSIDFVAAARFDGTYPELVRAFDWQGFYDDYAELFPALVDELGRRYDLILVDSRTGVTDIGSICTMALPDKLVLVFSPNEQSLAGALDAGWQAVQGRKEAGAARPLGIFPLVSRVEEGEEEQKRAWIKRSRERFEKLAGEAYGVPECDLEAYFNAVRIPHRGYYAYGERIAVEEQPVRESGSLAQVYDRLADSLECAGVVEAQRRLGPGERAPGNGPQDVLIKLLGASKLAERPSEAVRAYDDILSTLIYPLMDQGQTGVDFLLVDALLGKASALSQLYRFDDALDTYQDIIRRYGNHNFLPFSESVDQAIHNLGNTLEALARHDEALNAYEQLLARLGQRTDAHAIEGVARALFAKGTVLRSQNRDTEAVLVYDQLIGTYGNSSSPAVQVQVLRALVNKSSSLAKMGRDDAALIIREDIIRHHVDKNDIEHQKAVAVAWCGKIATMAARGDHLQTVAECDMMLGRFSGVRAPEVLAQVAFVFCLKSTALDSLGRRDDALTVLDTLMNLVGNVRSPELTTPVANALALKMVYLREMGRHDEASAVRADIIRRFRDEPTGPAHDAVADAFVEEARAFDASGRYQDALTVLNDFMAWFSVAAGPRVRGNFYGSLVSRSILLARLGRFQEAVTSADNAHARLSMASDAEAKALVPQTLVATGFTRICLAKQIRLEGDEPAAHALLEEADTKLGAALESLPANPSVMGYAAYAAFLLGEHNRARDLLIRTITLGGSKVRDATLWDAGICPLPEDDAFRQLVGRTLALTG